MVSRGEGFSMNVDDFITYNPERLQNFVNNLMIEVKKRSVYSANALALRDLQIGLFYYSDFIRIGMLKVDFSKNGYDMPYHAFRVSCGDNEKDFDREEDALKYAVDEYMRVYG